MSTTMPLACVPGAIPASERDAHFALIQTLFAEKVQSTSRLDDGYLFRFPADALGSVSGFVDNERKCCPFLAFAIELAPGEESVSLRLTGPEGVHTFLDHELPLGRP